MKENHLIVSNLGDCRAVLGHEDGNQIKSLAITHDHNCRLPLEKFLLQQAHPNEKDIVICKSPHACYVKGRLQLTRALGDVYLKYPEFNQPVLPHRSSGRFIPPPFTPPYVGSTPDVFHIDLSSKDKFLILASDGLWDYLTDQQAVDIVEANYKKNPTEVSQILINTALSVAAQECGMSLDKLKTCPVGRERRGRHDDTTAVVLYF